MINVITAFDDVCNEHSTCFYPMSVSPRLISFPLYSLSIVLVSRSLRLFSLH